MMCLQDIVFPLQLYIKSSGYHQASFVSGGEAFWLVWSQKVTIAYNSLCVFVQTTEGIIH